MYRKCEPGFYYLWECGDFEGLRGLINYWEEGRKVHSSYHCYLFVGDEKSLLFDTLPSRKQPQILGAIDEILDGRELDYVVPSHADLPHAANTTALLRKYPDSQAITSAAGTMHDLYYLEDAIKVEDGDTLDLGGDWEVTFHEPPHVLADQDISLWASEAKTGALCCVDWLAYFHSETECGAFCDELDRPVRMEDFLELYGRSFFWLQYVDLDRMFAEIDRIKEEIGPEYICPTHGNPIRENTGEYIDMTKEMTRNIHEDGMLQYRV
jgi:flavorubredoxin